jgi:hypothetical protein
MSEPQHLTAEACQLLFSQLVEQLADALAPRLADLLADGQPGPTVPASRRLLTIDELVALLPAGKKPQTWKAWLYQRTRLGQVPGCHRLGGRLFFNPDETLPWLTGPDNAPKGAHDAPIGRDGLDLTGDQSLHQPPMPGRPSSINRRRDGR